MSSGSAHDPYETRGRLQGAEASDEFARWRDLPPRLRPVEPAPLPLDVARLLHRLRLRYFREAGPAVLARAREEGWDHAQVLKILLAEEAAVPRPPSSRAFAPPKRPSSPPSSSPTTSSSEPSRQSASADRRFMTGASRSRRAMATPASPSRSTPRTGSTRRRPNSLWPASLTERPRSPGGCGSSGAICPYRGPAATTTRTSLRLRRAAIAGSSRARATVTSPTRMSSPSAAPRISGPTMSAT